MFRGPSRRRGPRKEPPFPVPPWCPSSPIPRSLLSLARGHRVRCGHPASSGNTACRGSPRNGPAGHSGLSSTLSPERRVTSFQYS